MTFSSVSKMTKNYSSRRGVEIQVVDNELWFYTDDNDMEPCLIYLLSDQGAQFKSNILLSKSTSEELPAWIKNDKHLRDVISFISREIVQ